MRKILRFLFLPLTRWLVSRFSSAPDKERIFDALTKLQQKIEAPAGKKGFTIPFDSEIHRFIIFSDQHKGKKDGADDFAAAEETYVHALEYYATKNYHLICLGDSEELWENTWLQIRLKNQKSFNAEKLFSDADRFTKVFGNHDLDWSIDPLASTYLSEVYGRQIPVLEGVVLETMIGTQALKFLCTHGHQGDKQSDGNWFSKFFVSKIWAPWQSYLRINPNTPAVNQQLKSLHNLFMYEWSAVQGDLVLITGHTHQPVFESLTHLEREERKKNILHVTNPEWVEAIEDELNWRSKTVIASAVDYSTIVPSYFNSGCCCYEDGGITGIEIADGKIELIKWKTTDTKTERDVLESMPLETLLNKLKPKTVL
jgi:predicted phosphodiesterase